jgi:hypothetical protein
MLVRRRGSTEEDPSRPPAPGPRWLECPSVSFAPASSETTGLLVAGATASSKDAELSVCASGALRANDASRVDPTSTDDWGACDCVRCEGLRHAPIDTKTRPSAAGAARRIKSFIGNS